MPAQVPSTGTRPHSSTSGSRSPSRAIPSVIVVDSPPGSTSACTPSRSRTVRTSRTRAPSDAQERAVRLEVPLEGEHAHEGRCGRRHYQPRAASSCPSGSVRDSMLVIAAPRPSDASATIAGSA